MLRVTLAAFALAAALAGTRICRVRALERCLTSERYEDLYYVPPPAWLRVFSLGFDEALADVLWAKALVYFGEDLLHRGAARHVFSYADAMLALDPDFRAVYLWAGTVGMYHAGAVELPDIRRSVEFLEQAARRFPDDGEIAWDLGASLRYELAPHLTDPQEKERVRLRGVEFMQVAARLGAGPPWLVLSNATELKRLGQMEQAIRHLEEMFAIARDPETRDRIADELAALRSASHVEALRHQIADLERTRRASFPYASAELFLLLGPRPVVDEIGGLLRRYLPAPPLAGEAAPVAARIDEGP